METSVKKVCYIHGCFLLENGREDAIEIGEGDDTMLKIYRRFTSTFYNGPHLGSNVDNIVANQPRPALQVWIPDYLLTGTPTELAVSLDGRFYIPRRLRLCEDNVLDSDSESGDLHNPEFAVIDVTRVQQFTIPVDDTAQIDKCFVLPTINLIGRIKGRPFRHPYDRVKRFCEVETGTTIKYQDNYKSMTVRYALSFIPQFQNILDLIHI